MAALDILIVDDERDIRALIAGILGDEGYQTREADGVDSARAAIAKQVPDIMILDIWLKDNAQDGLDLLGEIHPAHPDLPIIMISGHGTIEMAVQAIRQGAFDFIEKPFKTERLLLMLERAFENRKLRQENAALRKAAAPKVVDLAGQSPAIQQLRGLVAKVAASSGRVLLTGEAGVGKETIAKLIHAQSSRAAAPFLAMNCASANEEAQEIELFGITAAANKGMAVTGMLERANSGTLYLDEVADMPQSLQARILRFLQDGLVQPVGGGEALQVDVRIIAASSQDLDAAVRAGNFKADLYYRLNVVPILVPSLRDRVSDAPLLFIDFLEQHLGRKLPDGIDSLSLDAKTVLEAYDWPGNIRQLRNMAEWVAIMHGNNLRLPITARDLPPTLTGGSDDDSGAGQAGISATLLALPLRDAREQFELDYLSAQLRRFQGNVSQTAKHIGMERSALHRKMKMLGGEGT